MVFSGLRLRDLKRECQLCSIVGRIGSSVTHPITSCFPINTFYYGSSLLFTIRAISEVCCIRGIKDYSNTNLFTTLAKWSGSPLGLIHSPFMRMVPRNNFYEKPRPMPINHGSGWWPWNGYINWYDERTPVKRQYSWFTDRPRDMWPDLNLVHVDATSAHSNKYLFLYFETYTPNFCHFEIDVNDSGWGKVTGDRWTWVLVSGKNTLRVRAASKLGVKGKPSTFELYRANVPLKDLF